MTSEEYGQYIDDFELDVDVMPGESLTEYIERRRREFESKADGGSIGIEVLFGPKVPAAPSQLVEESEIVLGYRGDDAARSDRASGRSAGRADPSGGVDRSAVGGGSQYARNVMAQNIANQNKKNKINTAKNVLGIISPFINPTSTLGKVKRAFDIYNVYDTFKNVDPTMEDVTLDVDPNLRTEVGKQDIKASKMRGFKTMDYDTYKSIMDMKGGTKISPFEFKGLQEGTITEPGTYTAKDGGRVGLFMGGPALEGQALNIYNSMKAYGFSDQEIADALSARGLYNVAPAVETPVTNTAPNIINQGGGDDKGGGGVKTFDKGFSSQNFNLGPNKDVVDYEAEAYRVGPTFRGQIAKAITGLSKIPTPFNIARIGITKAIDFAKQKAAEREARKEKAAAAAAAQMQYENRRDNTGGYQSSFGKDTGFMEGSGTAAEMGSFKRGGLATMFTRRR